MTGDPSRWPSLAGQCLVAEELFGDNGFDRVRRWLGAELDRIDDVDFARTFSDHVQLPGVVERDFNHRLVTSSRGTLLGGIRFRGRDITRPFIEIVCHSFADLAALADCVAAEWAAFHPPCARLYGRPGEYVGESLELDLSVYSARCGEMRAPDHRVTLAPFRDPEDAVDLVLRRYAALAAEDPELARNVSAADPDDIRAWHDEGLLHAIAAAGDVVGALAIAPGRVHWIDGHEINEEVILASCGGNGYAASAQSGWAHRPAVDPTTVLVGTIERRNIASRRTATRAGRRVVLDATFRKLTPPTSAQ